MAIITRPYDRTIDDGRIDAWLSLREVRLDIPFQAPETGFIAFQDNMALAAGFLRRIEGGTAMIDGLITNPQASPDDRDHAASCVIDALIKQAVLLKIKGLIANTVDNHTLLRSYRHGFVRLPHVLVTHSLRFGES